MAKQELPARFAGALVPLSCVSSGAGIGVGEIPDLHALATWARSCHLSLIQLLPIFEAPPEETSPYSAISSFALDPVYLRLADCREIERSPAARSLLERDDTRREAKRLTAGSRANHAAVRRFKQRITDAAFEDHMSGLTGTEQRQQEFAAFRQREEWWLADHGRYHALWRRHGIDWRLWPTPLRNREPAALEELDREEQQEILRATFLQWLLDEQWRAAKAHAAAAGILLKGDLPFGIGAASVDAWVHQRCFSFERHTGAPPDAFSTEGQDWGLPLPSWEEMRRDGYTWWRLRARRAAALFDAFRVDHVIGLFRTWSVGPGGWRDGRFHPEREEDQIVQGREVLDVLLGESGPGRLFAEDLGQVPPFLPAELQARGIPGYKVVRWQRELVTERIADPSTYPVVSTAITGTHDTSTLVVWWEDELSELERGSILARAPGADPSAAPGTLTARVHRVLIAWVLAAGSQAVIFPIQDLFLWRQRFNTPGTVGPHNWSWRMPVRVEHLGAERRTAEITQALGQMVVDSHRAPAGR